MGRGTLLSLVVLVGCGRFGYDPLAADGDDGPGVDAGSDPDPDARVDPDPVDAGADAAPLSPVTVTIGATDDDSAITSDTELWANQATSNFGGRTRIRADGDPLTVALLRFDTGVIPAGATILAAELWLTTSPDALLEAGSIALYRVLEPWSEGGAIGAAGTASWNDRGDGQPWTTAGAGPGSRADTAAASMVPSQASQPYSAVLPLDLVQDWTDEPSSNHGVTLVALDSGSFGVEFLSSEDPTPATRPHLIVTYRP